MFSFIDHFSFGLISNSSVETLLTFAFNRIKVPSSRLIIDGKMLCSKKNQILVQTILFAA
jgi:hypothetical protein